MNPLPSVDRLNELLAYDPETGVFTWRVSRGRVSVGSPAGSVANHGYLTIRIDGVLWYAHRIAWKMATGSEPVETIDHIDRDRSNNKISNLREATKQEQMQNVSSWGSSKYLGVGWNKGCSKWQARIRGAHIGVFDNERDAAIAYDVAAAKEYGVFANLNFEDGS